MFILFDLSIGLFVSIEFLYRCHRLLIDLLHEEVLRIIIFFFSDLLAILFSIIDSLFSF
jgi:hypothetical protein